ncbi:CsgG/HfaB family protein [Halanaerobium hydrogeniformans]|uniref:Curli production assembly/transport component CsgG n=1 Tax=Halanaerobium hydrogeniformans TaxID=656519 RepID=E4RJ01_HALHG|nr:CsgG/HfaB family protein [Halanaerobium hydrogeniformans]ADQ15221.1 Curli production assembly/transport component CsgG [Halanaerobium hydrogeniformans]
MKNYKKIRYVLIVIMVLSILSPRVSASSLGDTNVLSQLEEKSAEILNNIDTIKISQPNVTITTQLLSALPERKDRVTVAVYRIEDRTGQFKDNRFSNNRSTVVTQGAEDMLITALHRSRQFKILDRIQLSNITIELNLKELDRIKEGEGPQIDMLIGADYIIAGAITEYQVDMQTGGLGFAIGSIGGNRQKAIASTAIDIRVIDSTTGTVVWGESLKGEIEGKKVGVNTFSFIGDNIVEFETGRGQQEVINLVVRTLLEEAVFKLSTSGIM